MSSARSRLAIEPGLVHAGVERARSRRPPPPPTRCSAARRATAAAGAGARRRAAAARRGRPRACGRERSSRQHLMHRVGRQPRARTRKERRWPPTSTRRPRPRASRASTSRRWRAASATPRSATTPPTRSAHIHGVGRADGRPRRASAFFAELFDAFPDWRFEVVETRGRGRRRGGALARPRRPSPGRAASWASSPTARASTSRASTSLRVRDGRIARNDAYMNGAELARQLGALPPQGSATEERMATAFNLTTRVKRRLVERPRARGRRRLGRARRLPGQGDERLPRARRRRRDALRRGHQGDDRRRRGRGRLAGRHHARRCSATGTPTTAASRPYLGVPGAAATPTTARTPRATAACATSTSPSSSRTPSPPSPTC